MRTAKLHTVIMLSEGLIYTEIFQSEDDAHEFLRDEIISHSDEPVTFSGKESADDLEQMLGDCSGGHFCAVTETHVIVLKESE